MKVNPQQHSQKSQMLKKRINTLASALFMLGASQASMASNLQSEYLEIIALTETELVIYYAPENTLYVGSGNGNIHYNDYHLDAWELVPEGDDESGDLPTVNEAAQGSGLAIKQWDWGDARAVFSCDGVDLILERLLADGSHEEVLVTRFEQERCAP